MLLPPRDEDHEMADLAGLGVDPTTEEAVWLMNIRAFGGEQPDVSAELQKSKSVIPADDCSSGWVPDQSHSPVCPPPDHPMFRPLFDINETLAICDRPLTLHPNACLPMIGNGPYLPAGRPFKYESNLDYWAGGCYITEYDVVDYEILQHNLSNLECPLGYVDPNNPNGIGPTWNESGRLEFRFPGMLLVKLGVPFCFRHMNASTDSMTVRVNDLETRVYTSRIETL
jgi:hypothetical protein